MPYATAYGILSIFGIDIKVGYCCELWCSSDILKRKIDLNSLIFGIHEAELYYLQMIYLHKLISQLKPYYISKTYDTYFCGIQAYYL